MNFRRSCIAGSTAVAVLFLAVAWAAAPAAADIITITTANGSGADTHVQANDSGPYGSATTLLAKFEDAQWTRKIYLRFDLSDLGGLDAAEATFSMTIVPGIGTNPFASNQFTVYGLTDEAGDSWVESTMKWGGAPANQLAAPQVDATKTVALGTFNIAGAGTTGSQVSITGQALVDFLNASTNNLATLIVVRDTAATSTNTFAHGFASKENTGGYAPPTLSITPVPEPSSLALALVALAAAAWWRGRGR